MKLKLITFIFSGILLFLSFTGFSSASVASSSVSVSLSIETFVKCTVENDEFIVMTNSYDPVIILEDGVDSGEKAIFGSFTRIKMKPGSHYAVSSEF